LALLPTANILHQEAPFAERYLLLTLVGVIGMVATLVGVVWNRPTARITVAGAALILVASCVGISFQRSSYFQDDLTFSGQWVRTNPGSSEARACLGLALFENGKFNEAIAEYQQALRIDPYNVPAMVYLGRALADRGQVPEAVSILRRAVVVAPDYPMANALLGAMLLHTGDLPGAAEHLERAVPRRPRDAITRYHLGTVFGRLGELDKAQVHLDHAIRLQPDFVDALNDLGAVELMRGGPDSLARAQRCFRRALEIDPRFARAHYNLGDLYVRQGNLKEAVAHFEAAVSLDPGHRSACERLDRIREAMQNNRQGGDP